MDLDFPTENNRYMKHLSPYCDSMKKGDDKFVEIDDRYGIYLKDEGDDRYTGWIYYEGTDIPVMAFRNETLRNIIRDAYELGIFTTDTAGTIYNNEVINTLNQDIEKNLDYQNMSEVAYYEYSDPVIADVPTGTPVEQPPLNVKTTVANISVPSMGIYALAEFLEHLAIDYNAKNVLVTEEAGMMEIKLIKSAASNLCKKYPIFTEKQALSLVLARALTKSNSPVRHIKDALTKLVEYKKEGKIKNVVKEHEKIDHELHAMVGEEGLRPEEKTKKAKKDRFGEKVKKLMDEGKPQKQALAIAYDMQRRGEL